MIAGPPTEPVAVPASVAALAGGAGVSPVWRNQLGGLTWQLGDGPERRFVKWAPAGSGLPIAPEAERLRWAAAYTPVPVVVAHGADDRGEWLVTAGLPGRNAVDRRWLTDPGPAVQAIGAGLRALHDALPTRDCPFDWSAPTRVADAQRRAGALRPEQWSPQHAGLTVAEVLARLADVPDVDRSVVCHGDACAPNTLLTDDGAWSGHVDLGALGLADRWADLAVATWSTGWNYGPGWERPLLDAYGVDPDVERMAYYRLLWDAGP
ncbi:aminoglycoside 3'-phosphotransferase [Blastococcus goldschmidtiae]|uniref:Aminoglycoside 3'-phosphotransferase n=1 Tax=Blastococcus goldschmidtiae TaxID=3075546 RepID=A0ABU2KDT5_9ACTN|nr:aminoglycoside 3'-phosphotransferase [Blastococcus sp. DSM 46792]MDT0278355.1 aminoglycoside 3'-phosphotransferase [Blastococcus sp. DSM 46792]